MIGWEPTPPNCAVRGLTALLGREEWRTHPDGERIRELLRPRLDSADDTVRMLASMALPLIIEPENLTDVLCERLAREDNGAVIEALTRILAAHAASAQDKPAQAKLRLAVGGKSAIFYLPLSVTERLGYFKEAGLDVEIADVQSGARALQSLIGGSADIGVGTFDHTIQMQAKGQPVVAVVQYGRFPGFVLGTISSKASPIKGRKASKA